MSRAWHEVHGGGVSRLTKLDTCFAMSKPAEQIARRVKREDTMGQAAKSGLLLRACAFAIASAGTLFWLYTF